MTQPSAYYRIEKRLADIETVQSWTWTRAAAQGVYAPRFLTEDVQTVWRLWRVFSV